MSYKAINLGQKFGLFAEQWQPKVIAEMNDYGFKIVRLQGDFIWHDHPETDETFLVIAGELRIDFEDSSVTLREGEMLVVPRGVRHKPFAEREQRSCSSSPGALSTLGMRGARRQRRTTCGFSFKASLPKPITSTSPNTATALFPPQSVRRQR